MSTQPQRRLERPTDRIIAGVCGGLGDYFEVDPVVVRIVFVMLTAAGGAGLLAYLILWIVMPAAGSAVVNGGAGIGKGVRTMASELKDVGREFGNSISRSWPPPPPPPPPMYPPPMYPPPGDGHTSTSQG
jgi:phage shock protein C